VVSFTPRPFYAGGKRPRYPLGRRLGEPHNWSEHCGEDRNFLPVPEIEHRPSSPLPVITPTEFDDDDDDDDDVNNNNNNNNNNRHRYNRPNIIGPL
jgi:hypothetical protein